MIYILAISSGLLAFAVISIVIRMILRDRIAVLDRINYQIGQFTNDQPVKIRNRKKKRLIIFEKQLGEALVLIGNCLRAGMTFQQAMANVSK